MYEINFVNYIVGLIAMVFFISLVVYSLLKQAF